MSGLPLFIMLFAAIGLVNCSDPNLAITAKIDPSQIVIFPTEGSGNSRSSGGNYTYSTFSTDYSASTISSAGILSPVSTNASSSINYTVLVPVEIIPKQTLRSAFTVRLFVRQYDYDMEFPPEEIEVYRRDDIFLYQSQTYETQASFNLVTNTTESAVYYLRTQIDISDEGNGSNYLGTATSDAVLKFDSSTSTWSSVPPADYGHEINAAIHDEYEFQLGIASQDPFDTTWETVIDDQDPDLPLDEDPTLYDPSPSLEEGGPWAKTNYCVKSPPSCHEHSTSKCPCDKDTKPIFNSSSWSPPTNPPGGKAEQSPCITFSSTHSPSTSPCSKRVHTVSSSSSRQTHSSSSPCSEKKHTTSASSSQSHESAESPCPCEKHSTSSTKPCGATTTTTAYSKWSTSTTSPCKDPTSSTRSWPTPSHCRDFQPWKRNSWKYQESAHPSSVSLELCPSSLPHGEVHYRKIFARQVPDEQAVLRLTLTFGNSSCPQPVRQTSVTAFGLVGDRVAAAHGKTNNKGFVNLRFPVNAGETVYVYQVYASMDQEKFRLVTAVDAGNAFDKSYLYWLVKSTPLAWEVPVGLTDFSYRFTDKTSTDVLEIQDPLLTIWIFAKTKVYNFGEKLGNFWFPGAMDANGGDTAWFNDFRQNDPAKAVISLDAKWATATSTIAHEYGHWFHWLARKHAILNYDLKDGETHGFCQEKPYSPTVAFTEGYATAFGLSGLWHSKYQEMDGTAFCFFPCEGRSDLVLEIENYSCTRPPVKDLSTDEGRVASVLRDLIDAANDDNGGDAGRGIDGDSDHVNMIRSRVLVSALSANPHNMSAYW